MNERPTRKPWWRRTKVWGTLIAGAVRLWGERWGVDPVAASSAALLVFGGVCVEGIIDAVSVFAREWKRGGSVTVGGPLADGLAQVLRSIPSFGGTPPTDNPPTE